MVEQDRPSTADALLPCPWCDKRPRKGLGFWCHLDRTCIGSSIIVTDTPEGIAAWNCRAARSEPPSTGMREALEQVVAASEYPARHTSGMRHDMRHAWLMVLQDAREALSSTGDERREALEEAAKVAESDLPGYVTVTASCWQTYITMRNEIARAIRALAAPMPRKGDEKI